jgi:hypothetical protein
MPDEYLTFDIQDLIFMHAFIARMGQGCPFVVPFSIIYCPFGTRSL